MQTFFSLKTLRMTFSDNDILNNVYQAIQSRTWKSNSLLGQWLDLIALLAWTAPFALISHPSCSIVNKILVYKI